MESNSPPPNNHEPPSSTSSRLHPPPDFYLFRDHLRPAGYMGVVYGGLPQIGGSSYQRVNEYHRHPIGMNEGIWRQIEKEKIREEIIAEMARRHILEAEVRRELMIERNLAMQTRVETKGFPALPPPEKMDECRGGETTGVSAFVRNEFGIRESTSQRVPEPKTLEKQKVIFKPEEKLSEMKQKSEVLPSVSVKRKVVFMPGDGGSELTPGAAWSCVTCQVSATSERALKEHLQGKRHLAKEAGLENNGNNFSIGLYPKTNPVPKKLPRIVPSSSCLEEGVVSVAESKDPKTAITADAKTSNDPVVITRSPKLDKTLKKKRKKKEAPACKTGSRRTQKKFKFWCEICQIGAYCENVMESHRKGKKHNARLLEQNTVSKPSMNPTEEAGEIVQGSASRDSALIIEQGKYDGYEKEAGEDGEDIAPKGLGVVAHEVELEGNQKTLNMKVELE